MNYLRYTFRLIILTTILVTAACSMDSNTRNRIFSDGDYESDEVALLDQKLHPLAERLDQLINHAERIVLDEKSKKENKRDIGILMDQVVKPLGEYALNTNFLLDPENTSIRNKNNEALIPQLVHLYNTALLFIYKKNPAFLKNKTTILTDYKNQILWDCDPDEKRSSCRFVNFYKFADSTTTVQIIKILYKNVALEDEKTQLIHAAFDIRNKRLDDTLRFMLLEHLAIGFRTEKTGHLTDLQRTRDVNLFATLFTLNGDEIVKSPSYIEMIAAINPWTLSRQVDDPLNPAMTEILKIASANFIYQGKRLHPSLDKVINELPFKVAPNYEIGYQYIFDNIDGLWTSRFAIPGLKSYLDKVCEKDKDCHIKKTYAEVLNNTENNLESVIYNADSQKIKEFMLKDIEFVHDEYYFLAHKIFFEHYLAPDAQSFWNFTGKDKKRFIKSALNLIKTQFVNNIVYTNSRMNNFYNKNAKKGLVDLLIQSQQEANTITTAWEKVQSRAKTLNSFVSLISTDNSAFEQEIANDLNKLVNYIPENIKFLIAYPSMYPLLHVMAKREMVQSFWFGDIDYRDLIKNFFDGSYKPWFPFNGHTKELNSTEIIVAFYYAIMTQTFKTYKKNSVVPFKVNEFFEIVVSNLMSQFEKKMDTNMTSLENLKRDFSDKVKKTVAMCTEEKELQPKEQQDILYDKNFDYERDLYEKLKPRTIGISTMDFTDLGTDVYGPHNPREDGFRKYLQDLYGGTIRDVFRTYNREIREKQILVQVLLRIYKLFGSDDLDLDKINAQFNRIEEQKIAYTKLFKDMYDEVDECAMLIIKREQDIRHTLIFREKEYLGKLFDSFDSKLGSMSDSDRRDYIANNPDEIDKLYAENFGYTQNPNLPNYYIYKDPENKVGVKYGSVSLTGDTLFMHKADYYNRLVEYFQTMYPDRYNFIYPGTYTNLTSSTNPMDKTYRSELSFNWKSTNREAARKNFVNSGLKEFAQVFSWAKSAPTTSMISDLLTTKIQLYKIGALPVVKGVDCRSSKSKDDCLRIDALELISTFRENLDFINISDNDEVVLNLIEEQKKYPLSQYENMIKKKDKDEAYSYLDLLFKRIYSDGKIEGSTETKFLRFLKEFTEPMRDLGHIKFIFPIRTQPGSKVNELEEIFRDYYGQDLNDYFRANREFLSAVKGLYAGAGILPFIKEFKPFTLRYDLDPKKKFIIGASTSKMSIDPFISTLHFENLTSHAEDMNSETDYYFKDKIDGQIKRLKSIVGAE